MCSVMDSYISFLSNRFQKVKVGQSFSNYEPLISGVGYLKELSLDFFYSFYS